MPDIESVPTPNTPSIPIPTENVEDKEPTLSWSPSHLKSRHSAPTDPGAGSPPDSSFLPTGDDLLDAEDDLLADMDLNELEEGTENISLDDIDIDLEEDYDDWE